MVIVLEVMANGRSKDTQKNETIFLSFLKERWIYPNN